MYKLIVSSLLLLLFSYAPAFSQATIDWNKTVGDCKGEFEERTKCMIAAIKALDGRANVAETRLAEVENRLGTLEKQKLDQRMAALESNTMKNGQVFSIMSDFRKQCLHWIDTAQPPTFVPCNSGPDPRDERFVLIPR